MFAPLPYTTSHMPIGRRMGNYMPGPELTRRDGSRPDPVVQVEVGKFIEAAMAGVEASGLVPEHQVKVLEAMKAAASNMWPEPVEAKVE